MLSELTIFQITIAISAFLLGGIIKGLSGIGLPMVALPILSFAYPMPHAVALTMMPILISNGWLAFTGGVLGAVVKRFWRMQLTLAVTLILASSMMNKLENATLLISAGLVLVISISILEFAQDKTLPRKYESSAGILTALFAGAIGGVSSLFGIPVIIFLSTLGLSRVEFISVISIIYFFASLPYVAAMLAFDVVEPVVLIGSCLAVIPAALGIAIANRLTNGLHERQFRRITNVILICLGLSMAFRGLYL